MAAVLAPLSLSLPPLPTPPHHSLLLSHAFSLSLSLSMLKPFTFHAQPQGVAYMAAVLVPIKVGTKNAITLSAKAKMLSLQSFLRKCVLLGYVGRIKT